MWITILGLALLDSLSFASIVVTIFLLLSNAYRPLRIMVYLLSVAGFYILLGIALMNGAGAMFEFWLSGWKEHAAISYIQLFLGVILVLIGVRLDKKPKGRSYRNHGIHDRGRDDASLSVSHRTDDYARARGL